MNWVPWQWLMAVLAAVCVGVSKTGVYGLAPLFIAIFANLLPAKQASGVVLPLLICGDIVAVISYGGHVRWRYLGKLFPWTAIGVVLGYIALGRIDDRQARLLIGAIILSMVAMYLVHRKRPENSRPSHQLWFAASVGVLAGFTTLVANAAGPLMALYFLAIGLPKMEFMGTGSVFFLLLNCFKTPFMSGLGLITAGSLGLDLRLVPAVLLGAWLGRKILIKMNQKSFERIALGLSALGGLKMLFF